MAIMADKTREQLITEAGLSDAWMENEIQAQAAAVGLTGIIGALSDPFTRLVEVILMAQWKLLMAVIRILIPQLFLRFCTGHWLDEYGMDYGLLRDAGIRTKVTLNLDKTTGTPLSVPAGTVFHIVEALPRRYQTLQSYTPTDAATSVPVQVEAIAPEYIYTDGRTFVQSASYNPAVGLGWASESQLPVNLISMNTLDQSGTDPELDDPYRARIFDLRSLKSFILGGWLFYERLLKTVAGVVHVTLDTTDPNTGSMSMTLYGSTGTLPAQTLTDAQTLFDAKKMKTDQGVLSQATALNLNLTMLYKNGGLDAEMLQKVANYFQGIFNGTKPGITRGLSFEAAELHDYCQETWPNLVSRITPQSAVLPTGNYFVPVTTLGVL